MSDKQKCSRSRSRSPLVKYSDKSVSEYDNLSQNPESLTIVFDHKDTSDENENTTKPTCPICLEQCIQPIKLPCSHIFCYLCVKGVHKHNDKCPLCRKTVPASSLKNPCLLEVEQSPKDSEHEHRWFYEGIGGWWQYDDRSSAEIEDTFQKGEKTLEMMIAGSMYNVDLHQGIQARKDFPNRKRLIKRDLAAVSKKGVAGIKLKNELAKKEKKLFHNKSKTNTSAQQNKSNSQQNDTSSIKQKNVSNSSQQDGSSSVAQQNASSSKQNESNSFARMFGLHAPVINIFSGRKNWSIVAPNKKIKIVFSPC